MVGRILVVARSDASGNPLLRPGDGPRQKTRPRASGGFVLAASDGISLIDPSLSRRTMICNPASDEPRSGFNDAKCDRDGRLWAGTPDRQETEKLGRLFCVKPGGSWREVARGFIASNGPSFSPDGRIMYHTRSHERSIVAFDVGRRTGVRPTPALPAMVYRTEYQMVRQSMPMVISGPPIGVDRG